MKKIITIIISPFVCATLWAAPLQHFAFVISSSNNDVRTYSIDNATGALLKQIASIKTGIDPEDMSIYNGKNNLFTLSWQENKISMFNINHETGALTPTVIAEVRTGVQPWSITFTPDGTCAYTGNYGTNTISQYRVNKDDGVFTPIDSPTGEFNAGMLSPAGTKVSASGKFLFAAFPSYNKVATFAINPQTCRLSKTGLTQSTPVNPMRITTIKNYLYVACSASNKIGMFQIMESDGALSQIGKDGSVDTHGVGVMSLKPSPDNKYLYANIQQSNKIIYFKVADDGSLEYQGGVTSNYGPRGLMISSNGLYAYGINQYSNSIGQFNLSADGNLVPMADSHFNVGINPFVIDED